MRLGQGNLGLLRSVRFDACPETGSHHDTVRAQHESCCQPAPVRKPAGRQHDCLLAGGIANRGKKGGQAPVHAVTAAFLALGDEDVRSGLQGLFGLVQSLHLPDCGNTALPGGLYDRLRVTEGNEQGRRIAVEDPIHEGRFFQKTPGDDTKTDPLVSGRIEGSVDPVRVAVTGADNTEATGAADFSGQTTVRNPVHRRQHDRMGDGKAAGKGRVEQLFHADTLP